MKKAISVVLMTLCLAVMIIPYNYHHHIHLKCIKCNCQHLVTKGMFCCICVRCGHNVNEHKERDKI